MFRLCPVNWMTYVAHIASSHHSLLTIGEKVGEEETGAGQGGRLGGAHQGIRGLHPGLPVALKVAHDVRLLLPLVVRLNKLLSSLEQDDIGRR